MDYCSSKSLPKALLSVILIGTYPTYSASYGEGRGAILLGNLGCYGNETRLVDCPSGSVSSCSHSEDAGVRCLLQTGIYNLHRKCVI